MLSVLKFRLAKIMLYSNIISPTVKLTSVKEDCNPQLAVAFFSFYSASG